MPLTSWNEMTLELQKFAEGNDYELAAVFAAVTVPAYWCWVKRGLPDSHALIRTVRETEFPWFGSTVPAVNLVAAGSSPGARPRTSYPSYSVGDAQRLHRPRGTDFVLSP